MDDLLSEFLQESDQRMARLDAGLAALSDAPQDAAILDDVHKLLRTIKGTSGFLNLPELQALAHAADTVVDRARMGEIVLTSDVCAVIVSAIDRIKAVLAHLNDTETEPGDNHDRLIDGLSHLAETGEAPPEANDDIPLLQDNSIVPECSPGPAAIADLPEPTPMEEPDTVRVKAHVLHNLLRMVSELVSTRNHLVDILHGKSDGETESSLEELTEVTSALRQGILQTQSKPVRPALLVRCRDRLFAIPQTDILEILDPEPDAVEKDGNRDVVAVIQRGDEALPLIDLGAALELPVEEHESPGTRAVLVIEVNNGRFGLVVDSLLKTEDILLQPAAPPVGSIPFYAGTAVLESGDAVMVLNATAFASLLETDRDEERPLLGDEPSAFLMFRAGTDRPMAVPLDGLLRLEEVDFNAVDIGDAGMSIPYHDGTLPLIAPGGGIDLPETGLKPVLVLADANRKTGLVVDEVFDIVDTRISVQTSTRRPGILGTAVLSGTMTEILDSAFYLRRTGSRPKVASASKRPARTDRKRLLLVDGSAYIRNLLTPILLASGFEVLMADTVEQALAICETNTDIDVVVTDIDLPDRDGFDLVSTLRNDTRWADLPVIAVSSHAGSADLRKGLDAGFTDYIGKYNRDGLLQAVSELL